MICFVDVFIFPPPRPYHPIFLICLCKWASKWAWLGHIWITQIACFKMNAWKIAGSREARWSFRFLEIIFGAQDSMLANHPLCTRLISRRPLEFRSLYLFLVSYFQCAKQPWWRRMARDGEIAWYLCKYSELVLSDSKFD